MGGWDKGGIRGSVPVTTVHADAFQGAFLRLLPGDPEDRSEHDTSSLVLIMVIH